MFPRPDYAPLELYAPDRRPVPVDLSDNTNLWGAHPAAMAAVRTAASEALTRYPDVYANRLRQAAAERFQVGPGNICTGCGSDDLLDSVFRAAAIHGGCVSYPVPTFSMIEYFARMNGRTVHPVRWSQALADPTWLLNEDPVLIYLCRPNNPTGGSAPLEWVRELLDVAGPEGPLVVLDEAYADFAEPGESLVAEAPVRPRLLVVRTLSKAYGLAGLRVGLGIGSPEVVREVEKSRGPYKVSRVAEAAALAALADEEGWVSRVIAECIENRQRLVDALVERGLSPLPTAANFVMVSVGDGRALRVTAHLREQGVAVRPFPASEDLGDAVRITVGPWGMMERFLAALDAALEAEAVPAENEVIEVDLGGTGAPD